MTTGEKIRARREQLGWTREQLSRESKMSLAWIKAAEDGKTHPKRTTLPLFLVALAMGVERDDLWRD